MKKPIVYTLFPVPLIENELDIPKKIKESLIKQKYERVTINNGHISVDEYILNKPKYKSLKKQILGQATLFKKDILGMTNKIDLVFQNSWVMKHGPGDWSQPHYHANSFISGILYLKTPDNSGVINFNRANPTPHFTNPIMELNRSEPNFVNSDKFVVAPRENLLLLFPSNLSHSVDRNKSTESKTSRKLL